MYSKTSMPISTAVSSQAEQLLEEFERAEAILVGPGAGMSASAGIVYFGERFERLFPDFIEKYHIKDMYSGGFHRFASLEEHWAWWSRHVLHNRYEMPYREPYQILRELLEGREYFVLTSNVDHSFQLSGFDKARLFYMQGDYGLWQCSVPCHEQTYDNEERIREMVAAEVKKADPNIQTVAVTAEDDDVDGVYDISDRLRKGEDALIMPRRF